MIIVNVTTISDKVNLCSATLWSILNQSVKPDKVILWISVDGYMADGGIPIQPEFISDLNKILNIFEVRYTENIGPYRKIIPALRVFNQDETLVYADDDVIYGKQWLQKMLERYEEGNKQNPVAVRVRRIENNFLGLVKSYLAYPIVTEKTELTDRYIITGIGGCVLNRRHIEDKYIFNDDFKTIAPMTDDLWISKILQLSENHLLTCPEALCDICEIQNNYASLSSVNNKIGDYSNRYLKLLNRMGKKILSHLGVKVCANDIAKKNIDNYFLDNKYESTK